MQESLQDQRKGTHMNDPGYGQARPDYTAQGAGYPAQGAGYQAQGAGYQAPQQGLAGPPPDAAASAKGFVASLFDFGFTSFVTPKVVKVVYILITIVLGLATVAYIILGFASGSPILGILALIFAPVIGLIYLALWRIGMELFIVIFRMADDVRGIRMGGGMR
jgi:hypothetical protein